MGFLQDGQVSASAGDFSEKSPCACEIQINFLDFFFLEEAAAECLVVCGAGLSEDLSNAPSS
jgi:hypothetical protein